MSESLLFCHSTNSFGIIWVYLEMGRFVASEILRIIVTISQFMMIKLCARYNAYLIRHTTIRKYFVIIITIIWCISTFLFQKMPPDIMKSFGCDLGGARRETYRKKNILKKLITGSGEEKYTSTSWLFQGNSGSDPNTGNRAKKAGLCGVMG